METEGKLSLAEVFVSITDPRQAKKVQHDPDFDTTQKIPFHNQCAKCGALICATTFVFSDRFS